MSRSTNDTARTVANRYNNPDGARQAHRTAFSSANKSAESMLSDIYKQQLNSFNQHQLPQIKALEDSLDDTNIIDRGRKAADSMDARVRGTTSRMMMSDSNALLPSQLAALDRSQGRAIAKGKGSVMTRATEAQRQKRVATRQNLMVIGEQMANTGTASIAGIAKNEQQRTAANKAANKGFMSQALGIAGAVVGGVAGGPAGASLGASIGSTAGGMFG